MRPRPGLHETEAETKINYCENETENVVLKPCWSDNATCCMLVSRP